MRTLSIIEGNLKGRCYLCGKFCRTEEHHIFGAANRKRSEKYGLKVDLCRACHNLPPHGAHFDRETMQKLHEIGEQTMLDFYGINIPTFISLFGRNYL